MKVLNLRFKKGYTEAVDLYTGELNRIYFGIAVTKLSEPPRVEALGGTEIRETVFALSWFLAL